MPVDKQVLLRYQVLNKCFRNRYREYTIDDLVDECNKALRKADKPDVSKRSVQSLILSFGEDIEVISPASFRDRIAEKIQATNKKYTDK
jgi:predicted DNA-binding transcriptional regulator YafY